MVIALFHIVRGMQPGASLIHTGVPICAATIKIMSIVWPVSAICHGFQLENTIHVVITYVYFC
jgi:hypothetical protein